MYVGIYIGEAIGSQIASAFRKTNTPWYTALRAIGIVGIVVGVLIRLVLREPVRRSALIELSPSLDPDNGTPEQVRGKATAWIELKETFRYVIRMRSFWLLSISAGLRQLSGNVFGYYMPSYLQALFSSQENLTSNYGIIVGVVGSFAVVAGGVFCSLRWKKSVMTALWMTAIGGIISSVFVILMVFSRTIANGSEINGVKVLYGTMPLAYITAELWLGAFNTLMVFLLPPRFKTFALAIYLAIVVFIYSSGPQIVGLALRTVPSTGPEYVEKARVVLAVVIPVGYCLAGVGFLAAIRLVRQDLDGGPVTKPISIRRKRFWISGALLLGALVVGLFVSSIVER